MNKQPDRRYHRRFISGGIFLGLGFGGFFDGIVLHQILQWHHMVSNRYPVTTVAGLEINTLADGLFHAATYIFTAIGVVLLWNAIRNSRGYLSTLTFVGTLLLGWGLFNVVEGVIDHHLLGVHHVRPGPNQALYDIGFLVWGVVMLVAGWLLIQAGLREERDARRVSKVATK